jgi:hypothetical protein
VRGKGPSPRGIPLSAKTSYPVVSLPTYFLTVFDLKKWSIKKLDKIRRGFQEGIFVERI